MNSVTADHLRRFIAEYFGVPVDRIVDNAHLRNDLGTDWLNRLELLILIEDQLPNFKISDLVVDQIETVGDLMLALDDSAALPKPPYTARPDSRDTNQRSF
jgi:acyl carrier protein